MPTVCVFEGDGAAPEAVRPTLDLLRALCVDLELTSPPVAEHADALDAGRVPPAIAGAIEAADAVLFGAARGAGDGGPHLPILKYLRTEYGGGLPANARPVTYFEGANSPLAAPEGIDYVVVRENLEGSYVGSGGVEGDLADLRAAAAGYAPIDEGLGDAGDGAFAIRAITERNTRRFAEAVCALATDRFDHRPVRVTCATKSNVLGRTDGLFDTVIEAVTEGHEGVAYEHRHVDNAGQLQVTDPGRFDVIAAPNEMGDVLSDVGVATVGGLGIAPSGCYGGDAAYFEPVHGTAPDIEGEGVINPTATVLSAAMMLSYLGLDGAADRLEEAVAATYRAGDALTPDQGGSASTEEMAAAIRRRL